MLSREDKNQYFEVLMALGGYNNMTDGRSDNTANENRGVSIHDSLGFYGVDGGTGTGNECSRA